ncbi:MAG: hypothetical protein ACO3JL_03525 [Myxococcota bacterium]
MGGAIVLWVAAVITAAGDAVPTTIAADDAAEVAHPVRAPAQGPQETPGGALAPSSSSAPGTESAIFDKGAPLVDDLSVAASGPDVAPVISAVVRDAETSVARVEVCHRAAGRSDAFSCVAMAKGEQDLFLARLPDGLQTSGFSFFLVAYDAAENVARFGAEEKPIEVPAASEGTLERLDREERLLAYGAVHPGWIMLSLGTGLLAAGVAGVFWSDYANMHALQQSETDPALRSRREEVLLGDLLWAGGLSTVAAVGTVTGVVLLGISGAQYE